MEKAEKSQVGQAQQMIQLVCQQGQIVYNGKSLNVWITNVMGKQDIWDKFEDATGALEKALEEFKSKPAK